MYTSVNGFGGSSGPIFGKNSGLSFGGNSGVSGPSFKNRHGITIGIFVGIIFMLCLVNYIFTGQEIISGKKSNTIQYAFSGACCLVTTGGLYFSFMRT